MGGGGAQRIYTLNARLFYKMTTAPAKSRILPLERLSEGLKCQHVLDGKYRTGQQCSLKAYHVTDKGAFVCSKHRPESLAPPAPPAETKPDPASHIIAALENELSELEFKIRVNAFVAAKALAESERLETQQESLLERIDRLRSRAGRKPAVVKLPPPDIDF